MAKIEMYVTPSCSYCIRAKAILDKKGVQYEVIDLRAHPERRREMLKRAEDRRTVPQIFINDKGVGGYDDIAALDQKGELDSLLGISRTL